MLKVDKSSSNILLLTAIVSSIIIIIAVWVILVRPVFAERSIIFPVLGGGKYTNDYLSSRSSGPHHATDIFANKHTPLLAAVDGTITYVGYPQPSWGYMVTITDSGGYRYNYIHINNDTPGTDDGRGGAMNAYAADIRRGNKVVQGQLIGWLGDSGNAENTSPHLHFEITRPDGTMVNPYEILKASPIKYSVNLSDYPRLSGETLPYGAVEPGLNLAIGRFNDGSDQQVVTGAGMGGGPHVKFFNKDMSFMNRQFFAYDERFRGGVDVAAGDLDGDGIDEIITGAGPGGGPHVRAFRLDGTVVASFFAYDQKFSGGVYVAAGDVNGDGIDEIITGAGPGGGPNVKVFSPAGRQMGSYFPYTEKFRGGVDVAVGDVVGDSKVEIITAAGPGGGPHVRVMNYVGNTTIPVMYVNDFFPYDANNYHGGVRVSVGNVQTRSIKSEILTAPHSQGGPHIKMFDGNGNIVQQKMFMEEWWYGFHDIAAGDEFSLAGTGSNRRASVRPAF